MVARLEAAEGDARLSTRQLDVRAVGRIPYLDLRDDRERGGDADSPHGSHAAPAGDGDVRTVTVQRRDGSRPGW